MALAIFDSRQPLGEGVGLQIEGEVCELKLTEIPRATAAYFKRKYPYKKSTNLFVKVLKGFLEKKIYHFYKVTPTKVWINDPNAKIDVRVEVDLQG